MALPVSPAYATVTETAILQGKIAELEGIVAKQTEQILENARLIRELRRELKALRDGVFLTKPL